MDFVNIIRNRGLTWLVASALLLIIMAAPLVAAAAAPNKPHTLTGIAKHNQVELKWRAPTGGATVAAYRIYRRTVGTHAAGDYANWTKFNPTGTGTTYTDSADMGGSKRYVYKVSALSGGDESSKTSFYYAIVSNNARSDDQIWKSNSLKASVSGNNAVLKWKVISTTGVTGYKILRKEVGTDAIMVTLVDNTGSRSRTYTDTNLTSGNTYSYRVRARYSHGGSSGVGNGTKYAKVTIP